MAEEMFKKVEEDFDLWPCVLAIVYEKTLYLSSQTYYFNASLCLWEKI